MGCGGGFGMSSTDTHKHGTVPIPTRRPPPPSPPRPARRNRMHSRRASEPLVGDLPQQVAALDPPSQEDWCPPGGAHAPGRPPPSAGCCTRGRACRGRSPRGRFPAGGGWRFALRLQAGQVGGVQPRRAPAVQGEPVGPASQQASTRPDRQLSINQLSQPARQAGGGSHTCPSPGNGACLPPWAAPLE